MGIYFDDLYIYIYIERERYIYRDIEIDRYGKDRRGYVRGKKERGIWMKEGDKNPVIIVVYQGHEKTKKEGWGGIGASGIRIGILICGISTSLSSPSYARSAEASKENCVDPCHDNTTVLGGEGGVTYSIGWHPCGIQRRQRTTNTIRKTRIGKREIRNREAGEEEGGDGYQI